MIGPSSLLSALLVLSDYAVDAAFNYYDFDAWTEYCRYSEDVTKPQQSPINIDMASNDGRFSDEHVELVFDNHSQNTWGLSQELSVADDGQFSMILKTAQTDSPKPVATFNYRDVTYSLDHIHSHWGRSEHTINDQGSHGNFHLVFTGFHPEALWTPVSHATAVIEIMVNFVDYTADDVISDFPRCPYVELPEGTQTSCQMTHREQFPVSVESIQIQSYEAKTIFDALGWYSSESVETVHYVGTLTTPPCSGPVNWFVRTEPIKIHDPTGDWLGCTSFRNAHPRGNDEVCGNYRPVQPLKSWTQFDHVDVYWSQSDYKKSHEQVEESDTIMNYFGPSWRA